MGVDTAFWEAMLNDWQTLLLIFGRVVGIFAFNPFLGRNNLPSRVRIGAALGITVLIVTQIYPQMEAVEIVGAGPFVIAVLLETLIGMILGFITNLFLSTLLVAGDVMDTTSGLGMSKIYDPASGVQMPLFGSLATYLALLYFFATNSHLAYVRLYVLSFQVIPLGGLKLNTDIGLVVGQYFGTVLGMAIKLALPFIAAQLILEFCMGIMMKAVPQIQVMVVNMQLKLLFGITLLFLLATPMSDFIDRYLKDMMDAVGNVLMIMNQSG